MIKLFNKIFGKKKVSGNDYVLYGMCPGFTVFYDGGCAQGHMMIGKSDTDQKIAHDLLTVVLKICIDHNLSIEKTLEAINMNLRNNKLIK